MMCISRRRYYDNQPRWWRIATSSSRVGAAPTILGAWQAWKRAPKEKWAA